MDEPTLYRHDRAIDRLAALEPAFAALVGRLGRPLPRRMAPGFAGLARIVVGQQVSVHAARAIWGRLEAALGLVAPAEVAAAPAGLLAGAGLSRQKVATLTRLADAARNGRLSLDALPADDDEAVAALVALPGIGRWTAEIFLLFAEGRANVLPAGDLAVRVMAGRLFGLGARPAEAEVRARAGAWAPHRGTAAMLLWHGYNAPPL